MSPVTCFSRCRCSRIPPRDMPALSVSLTASEFRTKAIEQLQDAEVVKVKAPVFSSPDAKRSHPSCGGPGIGNDIYATHLSRDRQEAGNACYKSGDFAKAEEKCARRTRAPDHRNANAHCIARLFIFLQQISRFASFLPLGAAFCALVTATLALLVTHGPCHAATSKASTLWRASCRTWRRTNQQTSPI